MKRRITVNQLNELSFEQKKQLRDWWKPEYGDYFADRYRDKHVGESIYIILSSGWDNIGDEPDDVSLPLLSIGQMIELLSTNKKFIRLYEAHYSHFCVEFKGNEFDKTLSNKELCDSLWEAVKQIL